MTSERSDFLLGKASQFYRVGKTLTQAIIKLLLKTHDVHVPINYIATHVRITCILLSYPVYRMSKVLWQNGTNCNELF